MENAIGWKTGYIPVFWP